LQRGRGGSVDRYLGEPCGNLQSSSQSYRVPCSPEPPSRSRLSNIRRGCSAELKSLLPSLRPAIVEPQSCRRPAQPSVSCLHRSVARRATLWWLVAGVLLGSVIPFTLMVILPTNKRLLSPALDRRSAEAERLLARWGRLHAVRSVLSGVALLLFLYLVLFLKSR